MKFKSSQYPNLMVRRSDGSYIVFKDGVAEVTAKADQELLKSLPDDRGVSTGKAE